MDIIRLHNRQIFQNEAAYVDSVVKRSDIPPTDPEILRYQQPKGLWLTRNSDGIRLKKGLSDGSLGLGSQTRCGNRYLEYMPFTPGGEEEEIQVPGGIPNLSIALSGNSDATPVDCDITKYSFNPRLCACVAICNSGQYDSGAACSQANTLTGSWITVANNYQPATDGTCRYEPNGGYLFCDEDPFEKFPGYRTVDPPIRYTYSTTSATGWYRTSPTPPFSTNWSPSDAIANGWTRYWPGYIYRKDGTVVIHLTFSASACDSAPAAPPVADTAGVPEYLGGGTAILWTTTGSGFTQSYQNYPYSSAPEPEPINRPTKQAPVLPPDFPANTITHLYGSKAQKSAELHIPTQERYNVFTVATQNASYMIVRTGYQEFLTQQYVRIRIYKNGQLISNTTNPELPDLEDLSLLDLWNSAYISYDRDPTPPGDPCAQPNISRKNLVKRKVYATQPMQNLNNDGEDKIIEVRVYNADRANNCQLTEIKRFDYKLKDFSRPYYLLEWASSYYPAPSDP